MGFQPRIVIVGGSLAGLTLALACASRGIPVHVVERAAQRVDGGDSLSVSLAAIAATTGHDPRAYPKLPVVPAYRERHLTIWPAPYENISFLGVCIATKSLAAPLDEDTGQQCFRYRSLCCSAHPQE